ncbi:ATP-dependent zinc metalloprotease FtsH [Acidimicrobiaceae bacterium AH-315-P05]|nr:ATP-dependent zinc metalloprotease FtsH [Acidimicrobiaceae bacterium AH-315-P05]
MAGESQKPGDPNDSNKRSREGGFPRWSLWILVALVGATFIVPPLLDSDNSEDVTYTQYLQEVDDGRVDSVVINNNDGKITATLQDETKITATGPIEQLPSHIELLGDRNVVVEFDNPTTNFILQLLPLLLPVALLIGFFVWMQRRAQGQMGGIMSIGRSKAKTYTTERPATTFDDIAGYEGVKQEIGEIVDFLKQPERYSEIGARIPKGVLLVGPPGTGKTLIARAVAGEAGVPFLSVTGSDFMEMFVGVGASRVRDLFESARKLGKAIIFIDEIDSIGRKRGAGMGGGHDEREQTLNQMLAEMDGFEATEGIVMLAATNRPDVLDPALLRPGRFDRQVVVPLPEREERLAILKVHAADKRMGPDVDLDTMAKGTPGMSGADLANLVNEAALHAVRRSAQQIEAIDFENARDRVLMGQRRESVAMSDHEKELTAYHEAGHALLATVLQEADPVHKVTILPTGQALGVTQTMPQEQHSYSATYIEDRLAMLMGGRMAEELIYGVTSTGAANDLMTATEMARKMVREWGMSERLGPMAWGSNDQVFLGDGLMSTRDYGDDTATVIDEEVERILREQEDRARRVLKEHHKSLHELAAALLERETVTGEEVQAIALANNPATATPAET